MNKSISIGNRIISEDRTPFIMAECGVTCNYDVGLTKELIDVVHDSGADGIKFIFWFPDEIMSDLSVTYSYETVNGFKTENMYEMLSKLKFSLDQWREVKAYADKKNVVMFATVNSPSGIQYAEELRLDAYKLSSWDFNYFPLWKKIAPLGKPVIVDTGPVNTLDLAKVMQIMREAGNDQTILVHCYHTGNFSQVNMRSIPYMRDAFGTLVGFSAKDRSDEMDLVAVALGSVFFEKRLTMDRSLPGHHHVISKEPKEFQAYVELIKNAYESLGRFDLCPSKEDLAERKKWFRHLVSNQDIPKGTVLREEMLESKRSEQGISPEYLSVFLGRKTTRDLKKNEAMTFDAV